MIPYNFSFLYKSFAVSTFFFFLVLSLTCLPSVISFQFQYNIKCRAFVNKYVDRHVSLLLIASWLLHYFYALEMFLRGKHESKVFFYPPEHVFTSAWEKLTGDKSSLVYEARCLLWCWKIYCTVIRVYEIQMQ